MADAELGVERRFDGRQIELNDGLKFALGRVGPGDCQGTCAAKIVGHHIAQGSAAINKGVRGRSDAGGSGPTRIACQAEKAKKKIASKLIAKRMHAIYSTKYIATRECKANSMRGPRWNGTGPHGNVARRDIQSGGQNSEFQCKFDMKRFSTVSETSRRRFIKFVTFGTATSILSGKLWQREVMAYCDPIPGQPQGVFKIRVSDYPALLQSWGSVRLGLNPVTGGDPFPDGDFYPILINRDDAGKFYVLDCECRHQSCVVPPFNLADSGIHCQCHGSLYWIDGSVLNGPAASPLGAYQFEFDGNDTITIHIQCWAFQVSATALSSDVNSRIQIDFYGNTNVTYELSFRERLLDPWTIASFAITPSGAADQTSIVGSGDNLTVYVDRPTTSGFYAVGMNLSRV